LDIFIRRKRRAQNASAVRIPEPAAAAAPVAAAIAAAAQKTDNSQFLIFPPYVAKAAFPQGNAAFAQERLAIYAGLCYNDRYIG
jgi:hypothetical protein